MSQAEHVSYVRLVSSTNVFNKCGCDVFAGSHREQEWVDDGSIDGDSVVSETSSTQDEIDKKAFDLPLALNVSRSFVDIIVIEAEDPSSFVVNLFATTQYN